MGQFASRFLLIAGEVAGDRGNFEALGAMLANAARVLERVIVQSMELVSRYDQIQNAIWSHPARERGNVDAMRDELIKFNR